MTRGDIAILLRLAVIPRCNLYMTGGSCLRVASAENAARSAPLLHRKSLAGGGALGPRFEEAIFKERARPAMDPAESPVLLKGCCVFIAIALRLGHRSES